MSLSTSAKILIAISSLTVLLGGCYLFWTFNNRKEADAEFQKRADQKQTEAGRRFRAAYGDDAVKIVGFLIQPNEIQRGQEAKFCYGVLNAKVVRLDPPIDAVHPAMSYCFNASPKQTTTFTLTAEDAQGKSVEAKAVVRVQ